MNGQDVNEQGRDLLMIIGRACTKGGEALLLDAATRAKIHMLVDLTAESYRRARRDAGR